MLDKFPAIVARESYFRSLASLSGFKPRVIAEAPDRLAQMHGFASFEDQSDDYRAKRQLAVSLIPQSPSLTRTRDPFQRVFLHNPDNYLISPAEYAAIDATLNLLAANRKKNWDILQLASNYGPYLVYLLRQASHASVQGIDFDGPAVEYATENGIPVLLASAATLPFHDGTFDVVFSNNFLEWSYLSSIHPTEMTEFINQVVREVFRVLRPGGYFISSKEVFVEGIETDAEDLFPMSSQFTQRGLPMDLYLVRLFQKLD